jgi:hypothetical protein
MNVPDAIGTTDETTHRLMQNLVLDMLLSAVRQAGICMSPQTRTGLQLLREQINDNQSVAARQCGANDRPRHQGTGTTRPLAMLMALLPVLQQLLQQMNGGEQSRCEVHPDAVRWAPRDSLRAWGHFFAGLADGMQLGNRYIADALGHKIH